MKIVEAGTPISSPTVSWLIYGRTTLGKTSLAGLIENSIILDFDDGAKGTKYRNKVVTGITYKDYVKNRSEVVSAIGTSRVIVIDSLSELMQSMKNYILETEPQYKQDKLAMKLFGKIGECYEHFHADLKSFGKDIVTVTHEDEVNDGAVTSYTFRTVGQMAKKTIDQSYDYITRLVKRGGERVLLFDSANSESYFVKNRGNIESEVIVPNFEIEPQFPTEFFERLRSKLGVVFERNKDKENYFKLKIDAIRDAGNPQDLNDVIDDLSNYKGGLFTITDVDKKLLFEQMKAVANANGWQYEKGKGFIQ